MPVIIKKLESSFCIFVCWLSVSFRTSWSVVVGEETFPPPSFSLDISIWIVFENPELDHRSEGLLISKPLSIKFVLVESDRTLIGKGISAM